MANVQVTVPGPFDGFGLVLGVAIAAVFLVGVVMLLVGGFGRSGGPLDGAVTMIAALFMVFPWLGGYHDAGVNEVRAAIGIPTPWCRMCRSVDGVAPSKTSVRPP